MIDYNFKVKSPSQEAALKMAEILVKKYGFSTEYIYSIKDTVLYKPYLFIFLDNSCTTINRIGYVSQHKKDYFNIHLNKEIDINVFIKTNGTMKPTKLLKQRTIK